jgi:membrane fusion protein (multidrug efflux system)
MHSVVAVVGVALAGGLAWWWQHQPAKSLDASAAVPSAAGSAPRAVAGPAAAGPAPVEVAKAESATLTDDVQAVGSLKSAQGVMLRPEVSGRVSKLGFKDGDRVRQGQLLVQLDDTLQQAQVRQAEAQAGIARTNLQRSRELLAQSFVSQSAVDQNAAALEVADAQVSLVKAQLARMRVLAPFNGTAGLRVVDVGDYVKDGADLVNLEDLSSMTVQFAVPERYVDRLKAGQVVELAVDALPGRSFKGRVQATDSQVDTNGRALQVLAQVSNPGSVLRPGMFARPRVVFAVRDGAVVVPEEALVPLGEKQFIFRIEDGADGKKVSRKLEARIGLRLPGRVEVLQGLKPGDTVVTAGHSRLLRGDALPVRVIDLSRAGAGPTKPASGAAARPKPETKPETKPAAG